MKKTGVGKINLDRKRKSCVVGITGGIATGKSTVLSYLKKRGVPVLSADEVAHDALRPGNPAYQAIERHFGKTILAKDGSIDRKKLGTIVFDAPRERRFLERQLHPYVRKRIALWLNKHRRGLVAVDIPLLFEAGMTDLVDRTLVVSASRRHQIERLKRRNRMTHSAALARIRAQWPIGRKAHLADNVIYNEGSLRQLYRQLSYWLLGEKRKMDRTDQKNT